LENKIGNAKKTNYIFYALLFIFALLTYFGIYYFSRQIAFYVPWDVSVVRGNALNFARGEHLDSEVYFQIYENNIPIVYVLGKLYKKAVEHFDYNNMENTPDIPSTAADV
jgi:Ni,Fe-hydrogenase I cytochrome b subunit